MRHILWVSLSLCLLNQANTIPRRKSEKKASKGNSGDYIDDDSNLEDAIDVNTIESQTYESNEVASEEIKTDLPSFESNENVESEFPIKHEEREPSEVQLSSVVKSKDEGKRMIENLVRKLKQMNKFLSGLVEYWDNEAAQTEIEMDMEHNGKYGQDEESSEVAKAAPTDTEMVADTEPTITEVPDEENDENENDNENDNEAPVELESTVQRRLRRRR